MNAGEELKSANGLKMSLKGWELWKDKWLLTKIPSGLIKDGLMESGMCNLHVLISSFPQTDKPL